MRKQLSMIGVCALAAAATFVWSHGAVATSLTKSPSVSLECGTRDVQFLTQLEHYGELGTIPGEILYAAALTMLRARAACRAGRSEEGLTLYDSAFGPYTTQTRLSRN